MVDFILSRLLSSALRESGDMRISLATGGSTTTVVDTNRDPTESERQWKDGTFFVLRDAGAANAAPEGQFARISAYSSQTFTLATPLTVAIANADRYGVAPRVYGHEMLIELVNDALEQIGEVGFTDTSITTAASQREYALPTAAKRSPVNVYIQRNTGDSNDNNWEPVYDWDTDWAAAGSAGLLIFGRQLPSGRTIKLEYYDLHPRVEAYNDIVQETIHPTLARKSLVERMANYLTAQAKQTDDSRRDAYNKAAREYEQALSDYPVRAPFPLPGIFIPDDRGTRHWPGDPFTVF